MFIIDLERLKKTLIDFNIATGITTAVFDAQRKMVYAYPQLQCDFCSQIRKFSDIDKKCIKCDTYGFDKSAKSKKLEIYKCHMGLTEAVFPLIKNEIIMGYLLIGQFLDENNRDEVINHINQIDYLDKDLYELIDTIQIFSYERIQAIAALMNMCASYLLLENIINMKMDSLPDLVLRYIKENLKENLTITNICNYFYISRSKLYTIAKKSFGVGISDFIRIQRIKKAKELLANTDMQIKYIADEVGIPDTVQFIKIFKLYEGITPKQYRNKMLDIFD